MNDFTYLTVNMIVESEEFNYPFTKGQIRHFLLHRPKNGLQKAVRQVGKRLFIRKDLFDAWIESCREPH